MYQKIRITTGLGFNKHGQEVTQHQAEAAIATAQKALSTEFGGCTTYDAHGAWIDGDGKLVCEPVKTLEAIVFDWPSSFAAGSDIREKAETIAKILRDSLHQECVVLDIQELEFSALV